MTNIPDPITLNKLVLVKQLFQNAVVLSGSGHSRINRILSIIGFDLCVETLLKVGVNSIDSSKTPHDSFHSLIQQLDNLLDKKRLELLPDKANIHHMHSLRNDAQHKAKYPNISDINDCRTYTRDFLKKVFLSIWGLDFNNISLIDMVQNHEIKDYLVEAEGKIKTNEYKKTILGSATGLSLALKRVKKAVVGSLPIHSDGFVMTGVFRDSLSDMEARDAYTAIEMMQDTVLFLSLGISLSEFMRYRSIAGDIYFTMDGDSHLTNIKDDIVKEEAEFVFAFCVESIIKIENLVGDIDTPFGKEWWY